MTLPNETQRPITYAPAMTILGFVLVVLGQIASEGGYLLPTVFDDSIVQHVAIGSAGITFVVAIVLLLVGNRSRLYGISGFVHERPVAIFLIVITVFSTGYYRALMLDDFSPWIFYAGIGLWISTAGIVLITLGLFETRFSANRVLGWLFERPQKSLVLSAMLFLGVSALFAGIFFEGIPHVVDAAVYATQAKILLSGSLSESSPGAELLAWYPSMRLGEAGVYGKYPIGWPLVLSPFVYLGVGWIANAVLLLLLAWLTVLNARLFFDNSTATLAGVLVLLSGWSVLASVEWFSHFAVTFWLLSFYYLFHTTFITDCAASLRSRLVKSVLTGLCLGMAVLTRQLDALVFSLPIVAYSLLLLGRNTGRNLLLLSLIALMGALSIAIILYINHILTGDYGTSTYGSSYVSQMAGHTKANSRSLIKLLSWFQQSLSDINAYWFAGVFGFLGFVALGFFNPIVLGLKIRLFLFCNLMILLAYGVVRFGGLGWYGPRWYFPLIPILSILAAAGLYQLFQWSKETFDARQGPWRRQSSRFLLNIYLYSVVLTFLVGLPMWGLRLATTEPHLVSGRLFDEIARQGIDHAVVGLFPIKSGVRNKLIRNAVWANSFPLDQSAVIYVVATGNWIARSCEVWPERRLYSLPSTDDFDFIKIDCPR